MRQREVRVVEDEHVVRGAAWTISLIKVPIEFRGIVLQYFGKGVSEGFADRGR